MKFFLDSAKIDEVKYSIEHFQIEGITTNPSIMKKQNINFNIWIKEILNLNLEYINLEPTGDIDEFYEKALQLSNLSEKIVIKVPLDEKYLPLIYKLAKNNINVNTTLVFSATQALLAARAGASFVSLFMGRLDDIGIDSVTILEQTKTIFYNYNISNTKIITASIRHPKHVLDSALIGADICTCPFDVLKKLPFSNLTKDGIKKFEQDAKAIS